MRLNLSRIGDSTSYYLENEYIEVPRPMEIEQMKEKQEHNQMIIEFSMGLNYAKFAEVKECITSKKMWNKLEKNPWWREEFFKS